MATREVDELAKNFRKLLHLEHRDGLTGLADRRALDAVLASEWQRGARDDKPLSFVLIDLDFFKLYNDHYGRERGDACLKMVAAVVASGARRSADFAGRFGGEEFALLLPNTPAEGSRVVAERMRSGIASLDLPHELRADGSAKLSVSIGVATVLPSLEEEQRVLVEAADAALYQAKRRGRNCVLHVGLDR